MKGTAPSVNFLKPKKIDQSLHNKHRKLISIIGFSILGLYGLVLIGLWGYSIYLGMAMKSTDTQIQKEKQQLTSLRAVETKYLVILDKIQTIQAITTNKIPFHILSQTMFELIPQGMEISGFSIDENGIISFSAKTPSILVLDQYYGNLEQMQNSGAIKISTSTVSGLSIDDKGACTFSNKLQILVKS